MAGVHPEHVPMYVYVYSGLSGKVWIRSRCDAILSGPALHSKVLWIVLCDSISDDGIWRLDGIGALYIWSPTVGH